MLDSEKRLDPNVSRPCCDLKSFHVFPEAPAHMPQALRLKFTGKQQRDPGLPHPTSLSSEWPAAKRARTSKKGTREIFQWPGTCFNVANLASISGIP